MTHTEPRLAHVDRVEQVEQVDLVELAEQVDQVGLVELLGVIQSFWQLLPSLGKPQPQFLQSLTR